MTRMRGWHLRQPPHLYKGRLTMSSCSLEVSQECCLQKRFLISVSLCTAWLCKLLDWSASGVNRTFIIAYPLVHYLQLALYNVMYNNPLWASPRTWRGAHLSRLLSVFGVPFNWTFGHSNFYLSKNAPTLEACLSTFPFHSVPIPSSSLPSSPKSKHCHLQSTLICTPHSRVGYKLLKCWCHGKLNLILNTLKPYNSWWRV